MKFTKKRHIFVYFIHHIYNDFGKIFDNIIIIWILVIVLQRQLKTFGVTRFGFRDLRQLCKKSVDISLTGKLVVSYQLVDRYSEKIRYSRK